MYKRGIFVLIGILFLLILVDARIPEQTTPGGGIIRTSTSSLQCEEGTIFGSCNSDGFLCVADNNLLNEEDVTNLVNSKEYLFFVETNCFNPVLKLDGIGIAFSKTGKRIVSQFISNGQRKEFTLECNGVEEEVENAYLGEVKDNARLHKDCQLCNCPEDEAEKLQEYVLVNNLDGVNSLSTQSYRDIGRAKIAVNTGNLDLCEFESSIDSVTCVQQVFDFNCEEGSLFVCRNEIIETSGISVNPGFDNGREAYRSGRMNSFGNVNYGVLDLRAGDEISRSTVGCDQKSISRSGGLFGTNLFSSSSGYQFEVSYGKIFRNNIPERIRGEYIFVNTFSQDLLCGYDDYWHLCDREGIRTFDNGEMFYCNGGTWIRL